MKDTDQQPTTDLADDDGVQITDLDPSRSPQSTQATRITGLVRKSLATPWIRASLSALLLLILLGALFLQLRRLAPTTANNGPKTPAPLVLSATTIAGLLFLQFTDHTLAASQRTTGHVRWHIRLSAISSIIAEGQTLYCFFRTPSGHTELEALAANTGTILWHDALPAVTASGGSGQFEINGADTTSSFPSIDGQIIYLSPPLGAPSASIQAFHIPDGWLLWTYPLPKDSSVQAEMDGMIYLSAAAGSTLTALRASDGHLLWSSSETMTGPIPLNGTLYTWQNNGQLDAWRESDGQHRWSYRAPIGSHIVGYLRDEDPLLFLLDPVGTFSVLRATDGKLLWRSP